MKRRNFVELAGTAGIAGSALMAAPVAADPLGITMDDLNALPEPGPELVGHYKKILKQNLLKEGETFVFATKMVFDPDMVVAMMTAAGELQATGAHVAVFPKINGNTYESGLTAWHWDLYAGADLLFNTSLGSSPGLPGATTAYGNKVGDHPYRTDFEYLNRTGSKTRWLSFGYDLERQRRYFPTAERRERTLRGAILLDRTRGELRVTNDAGSDFRMDMTGRPGHAQYGIADFPGRWDNFGYGCAACMPNEYSAEGVLVLQPGDIITSLYPKVLDEPIRLTFEGGYVTSIEGGKKATQFQNLLTSYGSPESFGLSHFGWGTHEDTEYTGPGDIGHYHHNKIGSLLYSLGMNFGHGLGGSDAGYSGGGASTRIAPNHTHFCMFDCDVYVVGQKEIEGGNLSIEAGGIA